MKVKTTLTFSKTEIAALLTEAVAADYPDMTVTAVNFNLGYGRDSDGDSYRILENITVEMVPHEPGDE